MFPCGHNILVKTAFFGANFKDESGEYDEDVDSYPYKNCAIYDKCIEEATVFHIWWGLPSDPALLAAEFAR